MLKETSQRNQELTRDILSSFLGIKVQRREKFAAHVAMKDLGKIESSLFILLF